MPEITSSDTEAAGGAETDTTTQAAQGADDSTAAEGLANDERAELERLRAIHKDERRWEKRAKENFTAAERWRKFIEDAAGTSGQEADEFDPQAELNKLRKDIEDERTERTRVEVARTKGVDPKYVSGATIEEMNASADDYMQDMQARIDAALKKATSPVTESTSTVKSGDRVEGPKQITTEAELKKLSPEEQQAAYKDGRLDRLLGRS